MSLQLQPPAKYTKIWQEIRYTRLFTNELTKRYPIFSFWTHRAWTLVDVRMVRATTAHTLSMLQTIFSQREPPRILFRGVSEAPHRSSCHERRLFFCLSVRRRCPRRHVSARINLTAEFLHRKKNYWSVPVEVLLGPILKREGEEVGETLKTLGTS